MSGPYSAAVLDHFHNPRSAFRMEDPDTIGTAGTPGHGPFMVLYLKLEADRIATASFQTYGCAPAIAAGSLLCERLPGELLAGARRWTEEAINDALGGLPPHKRHCSDLAARALVAALAQKEERVDSGAPGGQP